VSTSASSTRAGAGRGRLRRARLALAAACAVLAALSAPAAARAQDAPSPAAPEGPAEPASLTAASDEIEIARQTARDGLTVYKSGDYARALELFEKARSLYPSAQILRMTGYSHLAMEHWEKAVQMLEEALTTEITPLSDEDRKDVEEQLSKALAHFGMVTVTSSVKGSELLVDDDPPRELPLAKSLRLVEGGHSLVVRAPGHRDAQEDVIVEGGKELQVTLEPKPLEAPKPPPSAPKPPPPPPDRGFQGVRVLPAQREIGLAAAGTGLALGVATLVTGLAGADLRGDVAEDVTLHQQSFGQSCERGDYRLCVYDRAVINQDADRADTLRDTSLWLGVSSAVLFAGGATLYLLAPDGPLAASAQERGAGARPQARPGAPVALRCGPLLAGLSCAGAF